MARLIKMRFLDTQTEDDNNYIEVYCHPEAKRSYFRRINKELAAANGTTIKPNKKETYELKLAGFGWRNTSKEKFEKYLVTINRERIDKGWLPIELPDETE